MNNQFYFSNTSYNNIKFIHELKYQVRSDPKKYTLETAKQVESIFIQILLKSMRSSLLKDGLLDNDQVHLYNDIYDQKISENMSKKGIGLTDIILKQIEFQKNMF